MNLSGVNYNGQCFKISDAQPQLNKHLLAGLRIFCILIELTYWIAPAAFAFISVLHPCKPPLLGSFLLCRRVWSSPIWKLLEVFLLTGLEFGMAIQTFVSASHYALFCQISGPVLLWGRCQEFTQSNHIKLVMGYGELQIQEKFHNSSYRGKILPDTIFSIPLVEILSGFGLIALFQKANFAQNSR